MTEQQFKLEVPAQIKEVAEKTIDQAERGFSAFIEAANKSVSMIPNPNTDMSLKALSLTEQNMKAAFDQPYAANNFATNSFCFPTNCYLSREGVGIANFWKMESQPAHGGRSPLVLHTP